MDAPTDPIGGIGQQILYTTVGGIGKVVVYPGEIVAFGGTILMLYGVGNDAPYETDIELFLGLADLFVA